MKKFCDFDEIKNQDILKLSKINNQEYKEKTPKN